MIRLRVTVQLVVDRYAEVEPAVRRRVASVAQQAASSVVERSRGNLVANNSVRTGRLLAGQRVRRVSDTEYVAESTRTGGPAFVPSLVELGSGGRPAKPYFIPAVQATEAEYRSAIRTIFSW